MDDESDVFSEGATSVENHVEKVKEYFDKKIPDRNAAAQVMNTQFCVALYECTWK